MSGGLETALIKAQTAARRGDAAEAERLYGALLERFPRNARVRKGLEQLRAAGTGGMTPQAEAERLIRLYQQGDLAQVAQQSAALVQRYPQVALFQNILGAACIGLGDFSRAEQAYMRAGELDPGNAEVHNNHGIALSGQGRLAEASECFGRAVAIRPDYGEAHYNLGNALRRQQALNAAIAAYERALAIRPDHADALNNLGMALQEQGRQDAALAAYGRALAVRPDFADALQNLGNLMLEQRRFPDAIEAYTLALGIEPSRAAARGQLLFARANVCDFSVFDDFAALDAGALAGGLVSPFAMLPFADDPARQLGFSRSWADASFGAMPQPAPFAPRAAGERIRIGYFSADFHDHATLRLMAGLLREHDRQRFEITAYSYGPPRGDAMRAQLLEQVEHFVEVGAMGDADVAALARTHGIDIAVDLKGYTQHARPRLFAHRAAPVQVGFLGYPGTMGADFIDYIVADGVVVPPEERAHYAECVIALPGSYQPNDDRRAIAEDVSTRADHGLPEQAFVFCCFNHNYKISPREFDIWMRLLVAAEGSVLWLLRSNPWAEENLRAEAMARGVDPQRLVFAGTLPQAEHLARLRHADLFLDTFNVNAHTTASDALWAGLPVLTRPGRQFAARVAASLVQAAGLPELIAASDADYEAMALTLAIDPAAIAGMRARLAGNRATCPLFDTASYTRALEAAYEAAHHRRLAGQTPAPITL